LRNQRWAVASCRSGPPCSRFHWNYSVASLRQTGLTRLRPPEPNSAHCRGVLSPESVLLVD
jgi:hypothetical protein